MTPLQLLTQASRSRAFTLLEAIATMLLLSIAVPPALMMLSRANDSRQESVAADRAAWLATGVLEHILADVASNAPERGFDALADANAYLDTANTGLRDRILPLEDHYSLYNMTYAVAIGELVAYDGAATGDAARDLYRYITVDVSWPSTRGGQHTLSVGALVTDL